MEMIRTENLTFTYPGSDQPAIAGVDLTVAQSDFVVLCGRSGCGKTTLLRCLKHEITPHGAKTGSVYYENQLLGDLDAAVSASSIGFVHQSPENQIVTDTVWHELAFGLENIGVKTGVIRRRVAETAHFFGINTWFEKKVDALSGGQKQVLNLAAVTAMQPRLIVLDEPTAQLDPIAAKEFLTLLRRINQELGTTVILSEHRLEDVLPISDKVALMADGRITMYSGTDDFIRNIAAQPEHALNKALPSAVRISSALGETTNVPVTVREGRAWLKSKAKDMRLDEAQPKAEEPVPMDKPVLSAKDVWYRYDAEDEFVLRGLSCDIHAGRMLAVVGGNASGKTTALGALAGLMKPVRGSIKMHGKNLQSYKKGEIYKKGIAMLSQAPKTMFVYDTVREDLLEALDIAGSRDEGQLADMADALEISHLLDKHPYDLSGGEQQKAAVAKLLLLQPKVLLLDEPTKGIDVFAKDELAGLLRARCGQGDAVAVVTHDVEFAAKHADDVAMIFNGEVICGGGAREFFAGNTFYTSSANRMSRGFISDAVTSEDVIQACKNAISR